jgi:hypothetical protein
MNKDQSSERIGAEVDMEGVKNLLRSMITQKEEMYDYLSTHIGRGGYYYRSLCMLLKKTYLTITILGSKVKVEFSNGIIVYENDNVFLLLR